MRSLIKYELEVVFIYSRAYDIEYGPNVVESLVNLSALRADWSKHSRFPSG